MQGKGEADSQNRNKADTFDLVPPRADALIESLRAFSYDLPAAIADLVDNSITAAAGSVWIDFHWAGANSVISITDDGLGMAEADLVAAMRPGSKSPLAERAPSDLGRFGLGLKTASFSQCRSLSVLSRLKNLSLAARRWDLDHVASVNEWQLLKAIDPSAAPHTKRLDALNSGTSVVWCALDRLVAGQRTDDDKGQQRFLGHAQQVREHLAMVFHRLMSKRGGVKLFINGNVVEPWDPYLAAEPATQQFPTTKLKLRGATVEVQPFVLPHHSKIHPSRFKEASGPRGWNAHQGFYVYRHGRLLVPGDWLGFGWAKEEHYKLARIRIEIPNSLDHDWAIDVTKSRAMPPVALREDLRGVAERTRAAAKSVYAFRGAKLSTSETDRVLMWQPVAKHDRISYHLNRDHPLLKRVAATAGDSSALAALLRLVEETVPVAHIAIKSSEEPTSLPGPFEFTTESQIREVMDQALRALVASGYTARDAVGRLSSIWPFELHPALLQTLSEKMARD